MTWINKVESLKMRLVSPDLRKAATGRWKSEAAEDLGNGAFCAREFEGPWEPGKASEKVPGASDATFNFVGSKDQRPTALGARLVKAK